MSIWKKIGNTWSSWWYQGADFGGDEGVGPTGEANYDAITSGNALKLAAVWACVNLRASTIASLPLHLREGYDMAKDHPLYRILHDAPNADMTASEFWEAQAAKVDLDGNSHSHIIRKKDGSVISLNPLKGLSTDFTKAGVLIYTDGNKDYKADDILHLKGFTVDGINGLSKLEYARRMIGGQLEANDSAARLFRQSLKIGGFLKMGASVLQPDQRAKLRKSLAEFRKPENAGGWYLLEAGVEPIPGAQMRISPADAQLIESRYFGIEEVCRFFGVPPQLIGHTNKASSWASSVEGMNRGFLQYSLRPDLVRFEQQINKKLLKPEERGKYRAKFSVEGLLRADYEKRISGYASATQNGWMSRNEVRALEDLPPIPGGDEYTVQLNLAPVDQLGQSNDPKKETE